MRILRSVVAIVAGFGFMASTVMVGTIVATALFVPGGIQAAAAGVPAPALPRGYLVSSFVITAIGAILGGWLAARLATFAPYAHSAALAAVVAVLSLGSGANAPAGSQPEWYASAIGIVGVLGVLLGGKLRAAAARAGGHVVA
jgi:hypothetical protein